MQGIDNPSCKYVDATDQPGRGYVSLVLKKIRAERQIRLKWRLR
jgi:hypothetical protein